jgi:hypothetical protein
MSKGRDVGCTQNGRSVPLSLWPAAGLAVVADTEWWSPVAYSVCSVSESTTSPSWYTSAVGGYGSSCTAPLWAVSSARPSSQESKASTPAPLRAMHAMRSCKTLE